MSLRLFKRVLRQGRSERKPEAYTILTRPPIACRNRRVPRRYVEGLSEARAKRERSENDATGKRLRSNRWVGRVRNDAFQQPARALRDRRPAPYSSTDNRASFPAYS